MDLWTPATLTASVTYANSQSAPLALQQLIITTRPPGGTHSGGPFDDCSPKIGAQVVAPGQAVPLGATRAFTNADAPGQWEAYSTQQSGAGGWSDGQSVLFNVHRGIALGAWIGGSGSASAAPWDPARIDWFANLVGTPPRIVHWYQDWTYSIGANLLDSVASRGAMPMVTWEPWTAPIDDIASGGWDGYIKGWADDAAAWGQVFFVRFGHEMNGDWYPWCPQSGSTTSASYVKAWKHIVDIFRQEGATNVRWVWCPNVGYPGATAFADLYPGDAYVDWVALDGYNWGATTGHSWQALADVFQQSYDDLGALAPTKPIMIAETSSSETGGSKAAWIRQGLLTDLPTKLPRVQAVVWFDSYSSNGWQVDSSATSLAAFHDVAAAPPFQGRLP